MTDPAAERIVITYNLTADDQYLACSLLLRDPGRIVVPLACRAEPG